MVTSRVDPASTDRSEPAYRFDFCGGQLAIDFTNTVGSRGEDAVDHLNTAGDILAWAEARGVVSKAEASRLRRASPDAARRWHHDAIELRESLYRVLFAAAERRPAPAADLARFNRYVGKTFTSAELSASAGRFSLETPAGSGLDRILAKVVRSAVDLLTSEQLAKVGFCADPTCRWLFYDTTRSGSRRWCDMKSCGNRNKVRRFRGV